MTSHHASYEVPGSDLAYCGQCSEAAQEYAWPCALVRPQPTGPPEVVVAHGAAYVRLDIVKNVVGDAPTPAASSDSGAER